MFRQMRLASDTAHPGIATETSSDSHTSPVFLSPSAASAHTPRARDIAAGAVSAANKPSMSASERRAAFKHFKETVHSLEIDAVPSALAPELHNRIVCLTDQVAIAAISVNALSVSKGPLSTRYTNTINRYVRN